MTRGVASAESDGNPLALEPPEPSGAQLAGAEPRGVGGDTPDRRVARVPLVDDGAVHQVRIVLG